MHHFFDDVGRTNSSAQLCCGHAASSKGQEIEDDLGI
jgi:hypothetical protein